MPKEVTPAPTLVGAPGSYEDTHVHNVYDSIAHHFSSTRYKPWPVVAAFLESIPAGYVGLDAGTGNGKYLISPKEREGKTWTIGLDRSIRLLEFAKRAGDKDRECILSDVLDTCWRPGVFDFAISIATIHHLATPVRRKLAVQSLLRSLSPYHGRGLIYVWAIQQDDLSKRSVPVTGEEAQSGQDVFVPWILNNGSSSTKSKTSSIEKSNTSDPSPCAENQETPVYNRYYHMFDRGELRELVLSAARELNICVDPTDETQTLGSGSKRYIEITKDDWERSNYYVEFRLFKG